MIYVVFNPKTQVAYCRREYPLTFEQLVARIRCRLYEYHNNIRTVGADYQYISTFGDLEDIRIAIAEEDEERPWPYSKFTSYRYDHDMQIWLDTHPRAKLYPIMSQNEYKEELKYYRQYKKQ